MELAREVQGRCRRPRIRRSSVTASLAVRALLVQYGLNAVALVPHMVFIVDFVARGLGQGIAAGSRYWVLYGLGAIVGPLVTGLSAIAPDLDPRCAPRS